MRLRITIALFCLTLSGCNGINLGDNPGPDVSKQRGPLTVPPPNLQTPPR